MFVVPLQIGMALGLALLVNKKARGMGVFKVLYFAPVVISLTVTSYLWVRILGGGDSGLLNSFLVKLGIEPISFLYEPQGAMYWIIFVSAWQGCGYQMLIFLSGLKGIDSTLYEAAELDGAAREGVPRRHGARGCARCSPSSSSRCSSAPAKLWCSPCS